MPTLVSAKGCAGVNESCEIAFLLTLFLIAFVLQTKVHMQLFCTFRFQCRRQYLTTIVIYARPYCVFVDAFKWSKTSIKCPLETRVLNAVHLLSYSLNQLNYY